MSFFLNKHQVAFFMTREKNDRKRLFFVRVDRVAKICACIFERN